DVERADDERGRRERGGPPVRAARDGATAREADGRPVSDGEPDRDGGGVAIAVLERDAAGRPDRIDARPEPLRDAGRPRARDDDAIGPPERRDGPGGLGGERIRVRPVE